MRGEPFRFFALDQEIGYAVMRPPVLWTTWRRPITWHRRWWISTGCLSSSASNTNCVVMFTTYPLVTPLCTYQICSLRVPTSHRFPGCGRRPAATTSSRGRGWSWVKGRSLYLPLSHGIIFRMISRSLNVLLLLNVSSKHFYSNRRILKTNYVMRLRSSSRRRTKSHRVMLCYVRQSCTVWCVNQMLNYFIPSRPARRTGYANLSIHCRTMLAIMNGSHNN